MAETTVKAMPLAAGFNHAMCTYTKLGNLGKVKWLLDKDANTGSVGSAATKVGRAAMLSAIAFNQKEIFLFLLNRGAEVNSIAEGRSALMWALAHRRAELAHIILDKGADVSFEDSLHYQNGLFWACRLGLTSIAERIARSGCVDLDARDKSGRTALIEASIAGEALIVDALLALGAATDFRDYRFGWTALAWSIRYQRKDVVRRLLMNNASVLGKQVSPRSNKARTGDNSATSLHRSHRSTETTNGYTDLLKLALRARDKDILHILLDHLDALSKAGCTEIHNYDLALAQLNASSISTDDADTNSAALQILQEHNSAGAFSSTLEKFQ